MDDQEPMPPLPSVDWTPPPGRRWSNADFHTGQNGPITLQSASALPVELAVNSAKALARAYAAERRTADSEAATTPTDDGVIRSTVVPPADASYRLSGDAGVLVRSTVITPPPGQLHLSGAAAGVKITGAAELSVSPSPAAVGKVTIANRSDILIQAVAVELQLAAIIDRARETRINSDSLMLPELESLQTSLAAFLVLLKSTAPADEKTVGVKALSVRDGFIDWWAQDHVSILDRTYNMSLFVAGLGLIAHFGIVPAAIVASLIKGKEIGEALKQIAEIFKAMKSGE